VSPRGHESASEKRHAAPPAARAASALVALIGSAAVLYTVLYAFDALMILDGGSA